MKQKLKIGTRKSPLALKQADMVARALQAGIAEFDTRYEVQMVPIMTSGDQFLDSKLSELGGKGLFTKEIDAALLEGSVDITVHSAKDMPTQLPAGIDWHCTLPRDDARDYFISHQYTSITDLPAGAVVGTASLRREAFVKKIQPKAQVVPIRGNIQSRLKKLEAGDVDAIILAVAGLSRMDMSPPGHPLEELQFIPAPAQGILAIHCRMSDEATIAMLAKIHCKTTYTRGIIERELLRQLDGSCRAPIAAYATIKEEQFTLAAMLASVDSGGLVVDSTRGAIVDYLTLVTALAENMKATLLDCRVANAPRSDQ